MQSLSHYTQSRPQSPCPPCVLLRSSSSHPGLVMGPSAMSRFSRYTAHPKFFLSVRPLPLEINQANSPKAAYWDPSAAARFSVPPTPPGIQCSRLSGPSGPGQPRVAPTAVGGRGTGNPWFPQCEGPREDEEGGLPEQQKTAPIGNVLQAQGSYVLMVQAQSPFSQHNPHASKNPRMNCGMFIGQRMRGRGH